jgi:hypothetical protein
MMIKQRKPRCADCGSRKDVFRMPVEPGGSVVLCEPCANLAIERTLEAHPETYVRVSSERWKRTRKPMSASLAVVGHSGSN